MDWSKKVHVTSSMDIRDNQYSMFVGRWQPLHKGHQELFEQALNKGKNILICIRNIEPDDRNPFTAEQVKDTIENHYAIFVEQHIVKVIIIPDISSIEFGRGVGYDIIEHIPPTEIGDISGTKVREQLKKEGKL